MAGLLGYALAGAAAGAGNGLVERAKSLAAAALEKRQADQRAAERAQDRQWQLDDLSMKRGWDMQDAATQRQWDLQDAADARKPAEDATAAFNRLFGSDQPQSADAVPASYVRDGLVARGLPLAAAEGFTLEGDQESGLRPGINEQNPTVAGSRGGFGLFQWTGPRRVALERFAAAQGTSASDVDTQLDFVVHELKGSESDAASKIMSARDRNEAGKAVATFFLRPREDHLARRVARYDGAQAPDRRDALLQLLAMPDLNDGQRAVVKRELDALDAKAAPPEPQSPEGKLAADVKNGLVDPTAGGFRRATPEQAAAYGAKAGQFGPDGRFYPMDSGDSPFKTEGDLRKEFAGLQPVKNFQAQAEAMSRIAASAESPSPASDVSLIYAYMKMLDPGSVVRESEFGVAQNAAPLLERLGISWDKVKGAWEGKLLTPGVRADFIDRANRIYRGSEAQYQPFAEQYRSIATAQGVDPGRVIPQFSFSGEIAVPADGTPERPFIVKSVDEARQLPAGTHFQMEGDDQVRLRR